MVLERMLEENDIRLIVDMAVSSLWTDVGRKILVKMQLICILKMHVGSSYERRTLVLGRLKREIKIIQEEVKRHILSILPDPESQRLLMPHLLL
jgi:hypothetical protein